MFAPVMDSLKSPKTRPHNAGSYSQAKELQALLLDDARSDGLKPIVRAGLARAFVELEMLKLRLRMKPAPKPIDTTINHRSKARQPRESFTEGPGTNKLDTPRPSPLQINATPCASDAPTGSVPIPSSDPQTPQA